MKLRSQGRVSDEMAPVNGVQTVQKEGNDLGAVGGVEGAGEASASLSLTQEEMIALQRLSEQNLSQHAEVGQDREAIDTHRQIMDRAKADLDRFKHEMQQQIMTMVARALPTPPHRNWANSLPMPNAENNYREEAFVNDERNRRSLENNYFQGRINNMALEDSYQVARRPPIHEWGIVFEGIDSAITVDDFVFRVEHLQRYHNRSWNEIVGQFHRLLKGRAAEWYWTHIKMHYIPDWPTLRTAIFKEFSSHLSSFELERQLMERKQRPNEPIDDYIHEMNNLRSRLRRHLPEHDMIRILKSNVIESVGTILYPMQIRTVEQFRTEFHTVERTFGSRQQIRNQQAPNVKRNYYQVNEVNQYEDGSQWNETVPFAFQQPAQYMAIPPPVYPVVAEIPPPKARQLICWNCKVAGHTYFDCDQPRTIFCYKCGLPDTITPRCVRCQENHRRDPYQARALGSNQNNANH